VTNWRPKLASIVLSDPSRGTDPSTKQWSGRSDLNARPPEPHSDGTTLGRLQGAQLVALTPRLRKWTGVQTGVQTPNGSGWRHA